MKAKSPIENYEGFYSFYHDGWPCSLRLFYAQDGKLCGFIRDFRWDNKFRVTANFTSKMTNQFKMIVHEFNQMPTQKFTGYFFGSRCNLMAGVTYWRGIPFGFFGRKGDLLYLTEYGLELGAALLKRRYSAIQSMG
jgi:hypothetical protein